MDSRKSGGGQQDRGGSAPQQGRDQPRQFEQKQKQGEKPCFQQQFDKKKVAALIINRDATDGANATPERDMGSDTFR